MSRHISHAQTQTDGLRVDRRCGSVDLLENLLTLGHQEAIFRACLEAAELRPGDRVLDVGCGTGKLAIAAAKRLAAMSGDGEVHGIDATPGMVERSRRRADDANVQVTFQPAVAERLPFDDGSMDVVLSTFTFHHLPPPTKRAAVAQIHRVLRPEGRCIIADYGEPRGVVGFVASIPMRANFHEYVRPQLRGELRRMLMDEGFSVAQTALFLGYIPVLRAMKGTPSLPAATPADVCVKLEPR